MRAAGLVAAFALLSAGCVAGDTEDPGGLPHRDLAARPESLPPAPPPSLLPTASASAPGTARPSAGATSTRPGSGSSSAAPTVSRPPGGGGGSSSPGAAAPYRLVGSTPDGARDTEGSGPAYADIAAVTVEDDGTNARVTVTFQGDVPTRLPENETMGVGVDFFQRATQVESDYQLFTDGGADGWYAYLQTPKGFVRYQGRFGVGGRRIEFVVPWSALGSPSSGRFSAFADWTRDAAPLNASSEDHAPNLGNVAFSR